MSENGKTARAGATRKQMEDSKTELERQRDERIRSILGADPLLRELQGGIKGLEFALDGPADAEEIEST